MGRLVVLTKKGSGNLSFLNTARIRLSRVLDPYYPVFIRDGVVREQMCVSPSELATRVGPEGKGHEQTEG